MNSAQRETGQAALDDLERERRGSLTQVLGTWSADAASKGAAVKYFEVTVPFAIDSLRRRLDGAGDWDRWVADANGLHREMGDVLGYRSEWSMLSVLVETGKQTASDLGRGAQQVAAAAKSGTTWGVVGFALAALVAWRVLR